MKRILNQPYLVLDQYVDLKSFDLIVDDIILGIAKSAHAQGPCYPGPGYLDKSQMSVHEIFNTIKTDSSHPYHQYITNLKNWEPYYFIKYKWGGHTLGQCLILREATTKSYFDKDDESKCVDHTIKSNFKSFFTWLDQQEIFQSIGRVVIFLTEKDTSVLEHRDWPDGISRRDEFIWISPMSNKSFYIKDDEDQKHYVSSKFCYFDNANVHGSEPQHTASFSIRVDGKFTEKFKDITGLKAHLDDRSDL